MVEGEGVDAVQEFVESIGEFFVHGEVWHFGACVSYDSFGEEVAHGVARARGVK